MATKGPVPASNALKIMRGETRPSRMKPEPVVVPGIPDKPADMLPGADVVWDQVVPELFKRGTITNLDGPSLRMYVESVVVYEDLIRLFIATGEKYLIRGKGGDVAVNPLLNAIDKARASCLAHARIVGATPLARMQKLAPPNDPFEAFLRVLPEKGRKPA